MYMPCQTVCTAMTTLASHVRIGQAPRWFSASIGVMLGRTRRGENLRSRSDRSTISASEDWLMNDSTTEPLVAPPETKPVEQTTTRLLPPYHVIIANDDHHSMD